MHTVYHQGAGAGGRVSPHAHSPWPSPAYRRRTIPIHRRGAGTYGGRLLYGEADSIPHEEVRRRLGYAGQGMWNVGGGGDMLDRGCGMRKEDGLECDLCL